jgi:hypothetical protein
MNTRAYEPSSPFWISLALTMAMIVIVVQIVGRG